MGIIKEPLDVDFTVESRPITDEEKKAISNFIRDDKEKRNLSNISNRHSKQKARKEEVIHKLS